MEKATTDVVKGQPTNWFANERKVPGLMRANDPKILLFYPPFLLLCSSPDPLPWSAQHLGAVMYSPEHIPSILTGTRMLFHQKAEFRQSNRDLRQGTQYSNPPQQHYKPRKVLVSSCISFGNIFAYKIITVVFQWTLISTRTASYASACRSAPIERLQKAELQAGFKK